MVVEVAEGQPGQLLVDLAAEPVDRPLGDPGDDVGRGPAEQGAHDVDRGDQRQDAGQGGEVDPYPGTTVIPDSMSASWP